MSVPFPAPDGPVTTKSFGPSLSGGAVRPARRAVGQPADRLRLADPALVEEAGGLDATELRHRHQHVEDLGGLDVARRVTQDVLDPRPSVLEVFLELSPADANLVCPPQRVHSLVQGAHRGLDLSFRALHGAPF
jgi:hypothetical protein